MAAFLLKFPANVFQKDTEIEGLTNSRKSCRKNKVQSFALAQNKIEDYV